MKSHVDFSKVRQQVHSPQIPEEIKHLLYQISLNPTQGFSYKVSCELREAFRPIDKPMLKAMVSKAETEEEGTLIDRVWDTLYERIPTLAENLPDEVDFCEDNTLFQAFLKRYASEEAQKWFIDYLITKAS